MRRAEPGAGRAEHHQGRRHRPVDRIIGLADLAHQRLAGAVQIGKHAVDRVHGLIRGLADLRLGLAVVPGAPDGQGGAQPPGAVLQAAGNIGQARRRGGLHPGVIWCDGGHGGLTS
jgi:hypothetical protein